MGVWADTIYIPYTTKPEYPLTGRLPMNVFEVDDPLAASLTPGRQIAATEIDLRLPDPPRDGVLKIETETFALQAGRSYGLQFDGSGGDCFLWVLMPASLRPVGYYEHAGLTKQPPPCAKRGFPCFS